MGGKVADALAVAGITTGGQVLQLLERHNSTATAGNNSGGSRGGDSALVTLGLSPSQAATLAGYVRGVDGRPVADKGPPQSFQVQMTLTPWPVTAYVHKGTGQGAWCMWSAAFGCTVSHVVFVMSRSLPYQHELVVIHRGTLASSAPLHLHL